jgi:hypothetical protein
MVPNGPATTPTPISMQIATPIPATRTPNGPVRTITLLVNGLTGSTPEIRTETNSMGNEQQSSISVQGISQALNGENEEPIDRFETTMFIPLGDGKTMTMVSGGPRGTNYTRTSSEAQQYTVPVAT